MMRAFLVLVLIIVINARIAAFGQLTPEQKAEIALQLLRSNSAWQALLDKYGPDYPVGPDPHPEIVPSKRLELNPNDAFAIRAYGRQWSKQFRKEMMLPPHLELSPVQVEAARDKLDAFERLLDELPASRKAARAAIAGAMDAAKTCRQFLVVRTTSLKELERQLLQEPTDIVAIWSYQTKLEFHLGILAPNDPEQAAQQLVATKQVLERVADSLSTVAEDSIEQRKQAQAHLAQAKNSLLSLEVLIEKSLNQKAVVESLIGSESAPLLVDAWVNGGPVTTEDMRNSVVLLNFCWATWNHWTDTLPQRLEWHEEYGDNGLLIFNVTTYHNMRWDDRTNSPVRISRREEAVPVGEQRKAVAAFCLHNQLKFPFAIQQRKANYDLCRAYGGNPQLVLIDRDNRVHLIQSTDEWGTQKVSDALAELFGESAQ